MQFTEQKKVFWRLLNLSTALPFQHKYQTRKSLALRLQGLKVSYWFIPTIFVRTLKKLRQNFEIELEIQMKLLLRRRFTPAVSIV